MSAPSKAKRLAYSDTFRHYLIYTTDHHRDQARREIEREVLAKEKP